MMLAPRGTSTPDDCDHCRHAVGRLSCTSSGTSPDIEVSSITIFSQSSGEAAGIRRSGNSLSEAKPPGADRNTRIDTSAVVGCFSADSSLVSTLMSMSGWVRVNSGSLGMNNSLAKNGCTEILKVLRAAATRCRAATSSRRVINGLMSRSSECPASVRISERPVRSNNFWPSSSSRFFIG